MADVLPQLRLPSGEWVEPDRDSYTVGHRWGVPVSDTGSGVPFTRRPRDDQPLSLSFVVKLDGVEQIRWWALWFYGQTVGGARRFEARFLLPNGWRYCVCEFTGQPEQLDNRGYWLVLRLSVQIIADIKSSADFWSDAEAWDDAINWGDAWS